MGAIGGVSAFGCDRRGAHANPPLVSLSVHSCPSPLLGESAPQLAEPVGATAGSGPRLRRRGPRSQHARERRALRMGSRTGAERDSRLVSQPPFLIWHVTCQGLMSHLSEIAARLQLAAVMPGLLCLNEALFDRSVSDLSLPYYVRPRSEARPYRWRSMWGCGGVRPIFHRLLRYSLWHLSGS